MDTEKMLADVQANAARVADEHTERTAAITAERDAEALILERAIAAAKPALRALSSRIPSLDKSTSGRNGCNPVEIAEYHQERGLCLHDGRRRVKDSSGHEGTYEGRSVYVLLDGRLALVEHEGTWSMWQGSWDVEETTLEIKTARSLMDTFDLDDLIGELRSALDKQLAGNTAKVTAAARARAEKLTALANLVK